MTARKFAKCQPIERYSAFLQIIFGAFGFENQFLKCFLNSERDATEVQFLFNYISKWEIDSDELKDILHQSEVYYLEKFAIHGKWDDFFELFESSDDYLSKDFLTETLQRLFLHLIGFLLQKEAEIQFFKKSFAVFQKKGLVIDVNLTKKVIEVLNKYLKEEEYLEFLIELT